MIRIWNISMWTLNRSSTITCLRISFLFDPPPRLSLLRYDINVCYLPNSRTHVNENYDNVMEKSDISFSCIVCRCVFEYVSLDTTETNWEFWFHCSCYFSSSLILSLCSCLAFFTSPRRASSLCSMLELRFCHSLINWYTNPVNSVLRIQPLHRVCSQIYYRLCISRTSANQPNNEKMRQKKDTNRNWNWVCQSVCFFLFSYGLVFATSNNTCLPWILCWFFCRMFFRYSMRPLFFQKAELFTLPISIRLH